MCSKADEDVLYKEIQASIAEGRMMLPVLRSLPSSENNTALISLFEELIARLESYRPQGRENLDQSDVETQLNILKEKQERIRSLLTETALGLQTSSSHSQGPSSSHPVSAEITDSPTDLINQFKAWLVNNRASEEGHVNGATTEETNLPIQNSSQESQPSSRRPDNGSIASLNWSVQFAAQVSKLNDLLEDTHRFEGMATRLLDITRRARLQEPSEFLEEIAMRFRDIRRSFNSLRENYENLGADPQLTDRLREIQLVTFRDFCVKLDQNLESTKECFFTIYHLVKSNIEQGMVDGSLQEMEGDNNEPVVEENGEQPEQPPQPVSTVPDDTPNTAVLATSTPESTATPTTTEASLAAQHAYLAELQGQTRAEQEEIRRLLRQRDELAARLKSLREAANSAASEVGTFAAEQSQDTGVGEETTSGSRPSHHLSRLESKHRELKELKAQLALLRSAEEKVASLGQSQSEQARPLNAVREFLEAVTSSSRSTTESNKRTRCNAPLDGDTVRFQQPEVTRLNGIGHTASTAEVVKLLRTSVGAAASVAASQDRTTLATWGGSSPMAPSSSASSSAVDGQSADETEAYSASVSKLTTAPREPTPRHSNQPPQTLLLNDSTGQRGRDALIPPSADRMTMPQLGHSPSPGGPRQYSTVAGGDPSNLKTESIMNSAVEERFQQLESTLGQILQLCRCLILENSRINMMMTQLMAHSTQSISTTSADQANPALLQSHPFMNPPPTTRQLPPSSSYAWPFQLSDPVTTKPTPSNDQELLQTMWAQLMQQQTNYFHLQNEFQRLLRHQLGGKSLHQSTSAARPILTPMPSQVMSPASSRPASLIHPVLATNDTQVSNVPPMSMAGWPAFNPVQWTHSTGSLPPFAHPPTSTQLPLPNGFAPSNDPTASNFMSSASSMHEPTNIQPNISAITELFNQLWNPSKST